MTDHPIPGPRPRLPLPPGVKNEKGHWIKGPALTAYCRARDKRRIPNQTIWHRAVGGAPQIQAFYAAAAANQPRWLAFEFMRVKFIDQHPEFGVRARQVKRWHWEHGKWLQYPQRKSPRFADFLLIYVLGLALTREAKLLGRRRAVGPRYFPLVGSMLGVLIRAMLKHPGWGPAEWESLSFVFVNLPGNKFGRRLLGLARDLELDEHVAEAWPLKPLFDVARRLDKYRLLAPGPGRGSVRVSKRIARRALL